VVLNELRFIENASRRMQRLGYLKLLIAQASKTSTSTLKVLGNSLISSVTKPISVSPTPELANYLRVIQKGQPDKSLLQQLETSLLLEKPTNIMVQLQDVYLSSTKLPSRRGRLVSRDSTNYPRLATSLGLLRKDLFAPLVRGHLLLQLLSPEDIGAFQEYMPNINPMLFTQEQQFFFLYTIIESDMHIMIPLFRQLLEMQGDFADYEAGNLLPAIIRDIYRRFRQQVRSGADEFRLKKMLETAEVIEHWKDRDYKGKGARDETITVRLEPLVDLGILVKDDPFSYRYRLSSTGRHLMTRLTEPDHDPNIESQLFTHIIDAYNLGLEKFSDDADRLHFIYESYSRLKSPLGYAPINEVMLLGTLLAIQAKRGYFEIEEGVQTVRTIQQKYPRIVRFNVDRMGKLNFIKFEGKIAW
jgi:hypothetical protein